MPSEASIEIAAYGLKPVAFIALPVVLLILAAIAVALRVYVRAILIRNFGLDDWLLLLAFAVFVTDAALFICMGRLVLDGLIEALDKVASYAQAGELVYVASQIILKCSMALFFIRIVREPWQRIVIYASMSIYVTEALVFFFVCMFQCGAPTAVNFIEQKHTLSWSSIIGPLTYIVASFNAVIDWIFVLTPIMVVSKATAMERRTKMSVCLIIALGAIGSVISVVRIPYANGVKLSHSLHFFGGITHIALLSITETGIGIIAISLAALRPLYVQLHERPKRSSRWQVPWYDAGGPASPSPHNSTTLITASADADADAESEVAPSPTNTSVEEKREEV